MTAHYETEVFFQNLSNANYHTLSTTAQATFGGWSITQSFTPRHTHNPLETDPATISRAFATFLQDFYKPR